MGERRRIEMPGGFLDRMRVMLGDEFPEFVEALSEPGTALRVNGLRLSPEAFEALSPFALDRLAYPEGAYLLSADDRPGRHPYHAAGLYYIQDPGAMAVGSMVEARPGERVLDLSAAPGGKATLLAAAMENRGVLVANDVSRARAMELVGNLERSGVRNAVVTNEGADRLAAHFGAYFDRVLLDAPCSGESMFHKSAAARADWSSEAVEGCARRQRDLLRVAGDLVRPGGVLYYSTCTFAREENEAVVEAFLDERREFAPGMLPPVPGAAAVELTVPPARQPSAVEPGREGSTAVGSASEGSAGGGPTGEGPTAAAYRLWPHRVPGAGHFVAVLRRLEGAEGEPDGYRYRAVPDQAISPLAEFLRATYLEDGFERIAIERVQLRGSTFFELPESAPHLGGLNVIRPGLELGTARTHRFEPAHALAMALPPRSAMTRIDLPVTAPEVLRYLGGHPIEAEGPPGWWPVAAEGFALGWGKRVGTTVKNHYPKGLRRPA